MKRLKTLIFSIPLLLLVACNQDTGNSVAPPEMPPAQVTASKVIHETISEWREFTGRLEAPERVELRPRVSGYIDSVKFTEGALVEKGTVLFEIDPRPLQAEVNRLKADLESAQAREKLARNDLKRAQSLRKQRAIAVEQLESRSADLEQAQANVASIRAALASARLNLSFTKVSAPITGRVSNAQVTAGNYVNAGQTVLTSLVSKDKIHAFFDADEQTFLRYKPLINSSEDYSKIRVLMQLANEEKYIHQGQINFIDNQVNPQTGTIRIRAVFDNTKNQFTPGLFARLKVGGSLRYQAILIDDRAVATDLSNKFVLVVNQDNVLEYRAVILGPKYGGLRVVLEGLNPEDTIVTKGLQRAFPGSTVAPTIEPMARGELEEQLKAAQAQLENPVQLSSTDAGEEQAQMN